MKAKDLALIGFAIFFGVIISIIVSKLVFVKSSTGQSVEIVPQISSNFGPPDSRYFNSSAFDPTQFISIGNSSNSNPFSGTGQ